MSVHIVETAGIGEAKSPDKLSTVQNDREIKQALESVDLLLLCCYFSKAEQVLKKTLKKHPRSSSLWSKLGVYYIKQYKGQEAKAAFEKALQYGPDNVEALYYLGSMNDDLGLIDRAYRLTHDQYYLGLCNCYFKKLPEAFDAFVKAYESGQLALEMIQLYLTAANTASSLDLEIAFDEVLGLMNRMIGFANKHFVLGAQIEPINNKTSSAAAYDRLVLAAVMICEKALKENPCNEFAHYNLGIIYFMQGKQAKAKESFEKVIELNPRQAFAYLQLGSLCLAEGKMQESQKYIEQARQLFKEGGMEDVFLEKIDTLKNLPKEQE